MKHFHAGFKSIGIVLFICVICILAAVGINYIAAWERKSTAVTLNSSGYHIFPAPSEIQSGGQTYVENKDLITVLLLGIDTPGKAVSSDSYNNDQQADFLALLVIDPETNECTLLHINRDTMTDVSVLGVTGQAAGTVFGQIALAHTYGSGLKDSCENVTDTVSRLLCGITVDYYISINMDAVAVLNDQIGGVTVTIEDDFSQVDPELVKGETVTLTGEHALNFVRARQGMDDPTNLSRMARQRQFISAFFSQFQSKMSSENSSQENFILSLYHSLSDYLVTNCPVQTLSSLSDRLTKIEEIKTQDLTGTVEKGEFVEFYPDKDKLFELTMNTFFELAAS